MLEVEYQVLAICLCKACTFFIWQSAGRSFFSHFRLRSEQGGRRCITTRVWIPAELRGGALTIQRR